MDFENRFHKIGFFRPWFESVAYGRLYRYFCRILWRYQLPCFEMVTVQEASTLITPTIIVAPWDLFANGGGFPTSPFIKYILLVFEPLKNIEEWMEKRTKAFMEEHIIAYINLVHDLNPWFRTTFPNRPLFFFRQGYVEYEDGKILQTNECVKDIDVVMPGHAFGPDRPEIVKKLRDCGLIVEDRMIVGYELDTEYPRAKIHAYYPYASEYTAWHGQRTLWAVNKGICCVGVESSDKESERIYKDLYVSCLRETFVPTVERMVRSGEWKSFGKTAYERYRRDFEAGKMFDTTIVRFFHFILVRPQIKQCIPLFKVNMSSDAIRLTTHTLQSGFLTQGPRVEEFESKLAKHFGFVSSTRLTTVNSATTGLTLALRLLREPNSEMNWPGFNEQDYVLTSPLTCTATNWSVLANNYKLQWVDTCSDSTNISLDDLSQKLTAHSKIILFVHWGGVPVNLEELSHHLDNFEQKHKFRPIVIEDCAHAWGSQFQGKYIGTHGNICVFSFQAIKHLTTSDGGLVIWPNDGMAQRARKIRWFGIDRNVSPTGSDFRNRESIDISEFGFKWHMNDVNAAIGIGNLRTNSSVVTKHTENHLWLYKYVDTLSFYKNVSIPFSSVVCGWIFTLLVPDESIRTRFIQFMTAHKIQASQVHFRNDTHSCTNFAAVHRTSLVNLNKLDKQYVCIPCGWWLTQEELNHIAWALDVFAGSESWK